MREEPGHPHPVLRAAVLMASNILADCLIYWIQSGQGLVSSGPGGRITPQAEEVLVSRSWRSLAP